MKIWLLATLVSMTAVGFALTAQASLHINGRDDMNQPCWLQIADNGVSAQVNYIRNVFELQGVPGERGAFRGMSESEDMNFELLVVPAKKFFTFWANKKDQSGSWSDFGFTQTCHFQ